MVKLGFIVEGATEKIILEQSNFFGYLQSINIAYIPEVIDAEGHGNLLPRHIGAFTKVLEDKGATHIFILTDLDNDECVTNTKARIMPLPHHVVTVSKKAIELWFLSDTDAMQSFLKDADFVCNNPEAVAHPFEEIKAIRLAKNNRGIGGKPILAKLMVAHKFSISKAAQHPDCSSAKYFIDKITKLS